jgi:hypothetical protein
MALVVLIEIRFVFKSMAKEADCKLAGRPVYPLNANKMHESPQAGSHG